MSLTVKVARARNSGRGMPGVGDPGLLGWVGTAIGKVAGVAKSIPGPIGWAGTAISQITGPSRPVAPPRIPGFVLSPTRPEPDFGPPQVPAPGFGPAIARALPFGQTGMVDAPPIGSPAGYHTNKTAYFLKDGTFIPKESRWVKNRRRNPLNPRAASRAIGRLESLKKATARFSRITIRKKCCHAHTGKKKEK